MSDGTVQSGSVFDVFVRECDSGDGLIVEPRRGDALLFYSMGPAGALDAASYHGGCPVLEGEKWGANVWAWNRPRPMFDKKEKKESTEFPVIFSNSRTDPVDLHWANGDDLQFYHSLPPREKWQIYTHVGHVWAATVGGVEVQRWTMSRAEATLSVL